MRSGSRGRVRAVRTLGLILSTCVSCSGREEPAKPRPAPVAPESAPAVVRPPQSRAPALSQAEARLLLDRWLAAQNSGDFAGYRALYADRFQGTKRVGLRSERFDRQGWLRDRERMFARPMHVEASDVTITTTSTTVVVRFVQRWSSGTFQDRGSKTMLLVPSADGLRIANEELLDSAVERNDRGAGLAAGELSLVVHTLRTYVVLDAEAREELADGPPMLDSAIASDVAARRAVALNRLPAELAARRGSRVRLYGPTDVMCRARLGEPFLLRRMVAHFGTVQFWRGQDDGDEVAPATPEQVAKDTWAEAAESTLLVATLDDVRGDCSEALWARTDDLPDPALFAPQPMPDEVRARLERSVRALPAYRALAQRYAEYQRENPSEEGSAAPRWEHFDGEKPLMLAFGNADRQFVTFSASSGSGCGEFGGWLWALFEVRGQTLRLVNHPGRDDEPSEFVIDAIVDADRDGRIEVLAPNVVMRPAGEGPTLVQDVSPPFHDCGC